MKKNSFVIVVLLLATGWAFTYSTRPAAKNNINPLLGNTSFVKKYGHEPGTQEQENDRIKTHLLYVESLLREKSGNSLSAAETDKRNHLLNLLHEYAVSERFPKNYDYPGERKPCFIDRDKNICAVGYLVEKTAGLNAAVAINEKHQYETIAEMKDDPLLLNWVAQSGLTLQECAMIQPTYGSPPVSDGNDPNDQYITKSYGVSTGISAGVNIGLNAINQFQIKNGGKSKLAPVMGLATGAYSIINGIRHYPRKPLSSGFYTEESNETKKLMSVGNITLGSVSMILSAWNLVKNRHKSPNKISWAPYYQPMAEGKAVYGVGMTKRI